MRVRRLRERKRYGGGDDGGGGGRQRRLFPKPILAKAKPPRTERRAKQPELFPVEQPNLVATIAVGFEHLDDGSFSQVPIIGPSKHPARSESEKNRGHHALVA
jgi:hypothetical protein